MDGWDKYFLRMIVCLVLMGMKLLFLLTIVLSSSLQAGHQVYQCFSNATKSSSLPLISGKYALWSNLNIGWV